jgi:hypothetical protein
LFRLRFSAAGPADFPANFRHGQPAVAAERPAPAPSCHKAAADNNDTDRLAIERGENEGMPVHAG